MPLSGLAAIMECNAMQSKKCQSMQQNADQWHEMQCYALYCSAVQSSFWMQCFGIQEHVNRSVIRNPQTAVQDYMLKQCLGMAYRLWKLAVL